jgi:hypothetical protein
MLNREKREGEDAKKTKNRNARIIRTVLAAAEMINAD